jgi:4-amino-4-deoxy-L-arabinose transferase-like glycosyltransferase
MMQVAVAAQPRFHALNKASHKRALAAIAALALTLFVLRLLAPPNLLDQDQENPATYVLDVIKNGNWICQRDLYGNIASKPPVFTWLAAITAKLMGEVNLFALYLPGALALFGSATLIFVFGKNHFGGRAALFGAVACMLCTAGLKQFGLARTDGVFAFTVTLSAFMGYLAWRSGRGWIWFWLAAAAATLTKGPLGVVLAGGGLLAALWERGSGESAPLRGSQGSGVVLFLVLTVGWLALACGQLGQPVLDKLLFKELVYHAVQGETKKLPGSLFYISPLYYLARAAPWSLLAYYGLWQVVKRPALAPEERRFERFLFCWFALGLCVFSMSPHQRGDLLWPIMPAGALLAGREIARFGGGKHDATVDRAVRVAVVLALVAFSFYFFGPRGKRPFIRQTVAMRELAEQLRWLGPGEFPLTHTDAPPGLQVYLNTYRPPVSLDRARALLQGKEAAFVAVNDWRALQAQWSSNDPPLYTLLEDHGPVARLKTRIVSNRPELHWGTNPVALATGPWVVRWEAGALVQASGDRFVFKPGQTLGQATVANEGHLPRALAIEVAAGQTPTEIQKVVVPGERVTVQLPALGPSL